MSGKNKGKKKPSVKTKDIKNTGAVHEKRTKTRCA